MVKVPKPVCIATVGVDTILATRKESLTVAAASVKSADVTEPIIGRPVVVNLEASITDMPILAFLKSAKVISLVNLSAAVLAILAIA